MTESKAPKIYKYCYHSIFGKVYLSAPNKETLIKTLAGFGFIHIDRQKIVLLSNAEVIDGNSDSNTP